MSQRRFLLNFLTLLLVRSGGLIISIMVGLFLVRFLSASAFGAYSLATTTIGLMGVVADFGFDPILSREIAAHRAGSSFVRRISFFRIGLGLVLTILFSLLAQVTPIFGRAELLLIGGISLLPRSFMRTMAAALTGHGSAHRAAQLEGITILANSCLMVILVIWAKAYHLEGDFAAMVGLSLGNLIGALYALGHWAGIKSLTKTSTAWSASLRGAAAFTLIGLAGALFQALDLYLIAVWYRLPSGAVDAVALYAAPFRVLNLLLVLPTVWGTIALPRYSQLLAHQSVLKRQLYKDTLRWLVGGVLVCALCVVLAEPITTIALGSTYVQSVPLLQVLCWMMLFASLSAPAVAYLTTANRQGLILMSVLAGNLILLTANWVLLGKGLIGVALVKVLSMAVMAGLYWLAIWRNTTW
ncbi:MAG: hypothetical protein OHK0023_17570 [Anaerolineae bacterium]